MQLINNPDKSLISKWEIEVHDWPVDNKWIANDAFQQYQSGVCNCTVTIDDMNSLTAISSYKEYPINIALRIMGMSIFQKKEPEQLKKIFKLSNSTDDKTSERFTREVDKASLKYPAFNDEFIKSLPSTALYLDALAGIGVGGAGSILRYLINNNKFIYLKMMSVGNNLKFYNHFNFKRLLNTKYMYLLK